MNLDTKYYDIPPLIRKRWEEQAKAVIERDSPSEIVSDNVKWAIEQLFYKENRHLEPVPFLRNLN